MIELLRKAPLFNGFNDQHLQIISSVCKVSVYKAGTILFHEHEKGAVFYIVISGSVKIYTSNQNSGGEKLLAIFATGEAFGELSLLDGKPRSATAQAIEETKVISLTAPEFRTLLKDHFDLTMSVVNELCNRLRETNQQLHDLTFLDAKERVIKNLVKLANKHGTRNENLITFQLKLNHDEISQMAGVSRIMLLQVFSDLQNKQILNISDNLYSLNIANLKMTRL